MTSTEKRSRNVLTIKDKLTILDKLEKGETGKSLAKIFNVGKATISDINKRRHEILTFASKLENEDCCKNRKTMKKACDEKLDNAVYFWFLQKRSQGEPISGPLLCEVALQMNRKLNGLPSFKASSGWLKNFKSRHGIKDLEIQGKSLSNDVPTAGIFKKALIDMLAEEGSYTKDDVYNADETNLYWKSLPCKSLASQRENSPGCKGSKQRITVMVCANASGNHAVPLLVIGKANNPKCFKNMAFLPVRYKAQKNSWMYSNIFLEWFIEDFIPIVTRHRESKGRTGKVLLIIDNAPFHPPLEQLNSVHDNFTVISMPLNITAILQPMDQGVKQKLKIMYKVQVMRRLLLPDGDEDTVVEFSKKLNIKDCCYMLADAWKVLSEGNLHNAWNKLWGDAAEEIKSHFQDFHGDISEITTLFQEIPGFSECDREDAEEWIKNDADDPGFDMLIKEESVPSVKNESCANFDPDNSDDEDKVENGPTHAEACSALETAMAWCEQQSECSSTDILLLKRMRDLATRKRRCPIVHKKYLDFTLKKICTYENM